MSFSRELADIRFGCGLSPLYPAPADAGAVLASLDAPDLAARDFPIEPYSAFSARDMAEALDLRRARRKNPGDSALQEAIVRSNRASVAKSHRDAAAIMFRWTHSTAPFRERLTAFWADHFTVKGKANPLRAGVSPYIEEAIRPRIAGSFADLLIAAAIHPMMLHFLDQNSSVGPNSRFGKGHKRLKGLNENLAREVMELHTLGVGGPYTQADVRQLAELFTGLTYTRVGESRFHVARAEPGAEQVLGQSYGGDPARLKHVHQALTDLALHPATAQHLATKLARHFVSEQPDPGLISHMAARYSATRGNLRDTYAAMLEHPAAWADPFRNIKPHADYIATACRALAVPGDLLGRMKLGQMRRAFIGPLRLMGQPWQWPNGPDGWSEDDTAWITPQAVAGRLRWAVSTPQRLIRELPEPESFAGATLGPYLSEPVRFAARAAESRAEAIGLVLSAPAFQRR